MRSLLLLVLVIVALADARAGHIIAPPKSFKITDAQNNTRLYFDKFGNLQIGYYDSQRNLDVNGVVHTESTPYELTATASRELIVTASNGDIVALFDPTYIYNENSYERVQPTLYIAGKIYQQQTTLNPPMGSFEVTNSTGGVVAYINSFGDLYLKGSIGNRTTITGGVSVLTNSSGMPAGYFQGQPDGPLSVIPYTAGNTSSVQVYFPQGQTYRFRTANTFLATDLSISGTESQKFLLDPYNASPTVPQNNKSHTEPLGVFGRAAGQGCSGWPNYGQGGFDGGGRWIYSVFRPYPATQPEYLLGFYHAEDQYWSGYDNCYNTQTGEAPKAYFSVARCESFDNGQTWTSSGQIITSHHAKPPEPKWSGAGNQCVVKNHVDGYYYCFYNDVRSNRIKLARSTHPVGAVGEWFKWTASAGFVELGLGGVGDPIPAFIAYPGNNPHVHYNLHLGKWIMLYYTHDCPSDDCMNGCFPERENSIYVSTSQDLINWSQPVPLLQGHEDINPCSSEQPPTCCPENTPGPRYMHVGVVGITGLHHTTDKFAGHSAWLYYSYFENRFNGLSSRQMQRRLIRFR